MTTTTVSTVVDAVNGPDGLAPDWDAIDWGSCRAEVERLRRRIFTQDLLEPCAVKVARTVLRGRRHRNVPPLPDETRPREVPGRATPRALRVDRKKGSQPILRKQFAELPCAAVPIVDIDASRNAP